MVQMELAQDPGSSARHSQKGIPCLDQQKGKESPLDFTATHASTLPILACVSVSKVNSIFFR